MTRSNPLNRKTTTLGVRLLSAGALLATTLVAGGSDMFAPASVSSALPGAFGEAASRGDVQVVPSYGALRPTEGDSAVLITTREQDGDRPGRARVSSLSFDGFSIPADTGTLRIDYNFLTNERLRSKSVDHFSVVLLQPSTGGEIELLRLASDAQLQAVPGAPFMRQSGFRSLVADVSQYAGALEQFSLVLRVVDRGRADAPSGLFIDNIRFEPPGAPLADSSVEHVAVNRGEAVSLDGSVSADPNGAIVDYFWTFGDGSTASGAVVSHRYMNAGTYQATLTVTDADGNTSTDTFQVTARGGNAAPAIVSSPNTGATENLPYVYQVLADDPDVGDTLTYSLTQAPAGMTIDANSGLISWTPAPGVAARSDVTVEVEDTGLLTDTQSFTVVIGPEFYVIAVDDSARLFEATAYSNGTFSTLDQIGDNGSNNRGGPAIADFDGDGDFDMVSGNGANPSMNLWYWERDEGRFMPPAYLGQIGDTLATAGGRAMDSAVADFNNDGRMDFAINGESTNSWLFLNNGNFTFGAEDFFSSDFEID
ncbi:MAG: PKD domain-containing protein, partial [Pseudomonadota bacterium]